MPDELPFIWKQVGIMALGGKLMTFTGGFRIQLIQTQSHTPAQAPWMITNHTARTRLHRYFSCLQTAQVKTPALQ